MTKLPSINSLPVPTPDPELQYETVLFEREFLFKGLKSLLGAADISKAGDRMAGLTAQSPLEREAARKILSDLTVAHIYNRPLTTDSGEIDEVMRCGYDINQKEFESVSHLTMGELKDLLLTLSGKN